MATVITCGTSGRNYSTFAAAIAAIPATPTGGYIVESYNDSEFTSGFSVDGFTTSATNFIRVTTGSGQSYIDHAGAATNPQFYDASKGVGLNDAGNTSAVYINSDFVTVEKIQIKKSGGNFLTPCIVFIDNNCDSSVVRNVIGGRTYTDFQDTPLVQVQSKCFIANCLFYMTSSSGGPVIGCKTFDVPKIIACAFINTSGAGSSIAIQQIFSTGSIFIDCAFFGWSVLQEDASAIATYCASDLSSGFSPGTGCVYSLTASNEFENASTDFRLKSGNHMNVGQRQQMYTNDLDIIGQPRSTTAPCIGQWEFQTGGGVDTLLSQASY